MWLHLLLVSCLVVHFSCGLLARGGAGRRGAVATLQAGRSRARAEKSAENSGGGVEFIALEDLKALWEKAGRPKASFDEQAALMELISKKQSGGVDDGDGDDDDDDGEVDGDSVVEEWISSSSESRQLQSSFAVGEEGATMNMEKENALWQARAGVSNEPVVSKKAKMQQRNAQPRLQAKVKVQTQAQATATATATAAAAAPATVAPILEGRSVGIDLGTTYSSVSVIEGGVPVIIPLDGARIVRSVVGYLPQGKVIVGEAAHRQMVVNPANTYSSVKRIIGRTLRQLKDNGDNLSVLKVATRSTGVSRGSVSDNKGASDNKGSPAISPPPPAELAQVASPLMRRNLQAEEVSAEVLRALLRCAEAYMKEGPIKRAVITVPAYFLPAQCEATERAGKLAGLEKIKLLREPEAAALAYGLTQQKRQIVLVFDLGGGTFDVSVLEVGAGFVEVIATSGDAHLGGDDFDEAIVNFLLDELRRTTAETNPVDLARLKKDPFVMSRLHEAAEKAKIALTTEPAVNITIPLLYGDVTLQATLTKKRFESLIKPLLARLLKPLREVAIMSGINLPGESGQLGINEGAFAEEDDDDDKGSSGYGGARGGGGDESDVVGYMSGSGEVGLSPQALKLSQLRGKAQAKARKKIKGSTSRELRRLQKDLGDPSLSIFPGGQQLDDVVMVGGSTRVPAVVRLVRAVAGIEPRRSVNPDEAVSLGAAIMGGILDGTVTNMNVVTAWQAAMYRVFYEEQKKGGAGLGVSMGGGMPSTGYSGKNVPTLVPPKPRTLKMKGGVGDKDGKGGREGGEEEREGGEEEREGGGNEVKEGGMAGLRKGSLLLRRRSK